MRGRTLVVAIALGLAACGGADQNAVEFLVFGEPEEVKGYQAVIDAYESLHEGTEVRLVVAASRSDLLTRLSTSIATGTPPDVFLVNYRFYGQYAATGALEPMNERFQNSTEFEPEDFYSVALEAFTWDAMQMCLPQNVSSLALFYNRALFRTAGVDEPPDDWTWNEMVEAATAMTVDVDGDGFIDRHGLGVEPGIIRLAPFVWSAGGELFDDPDNPTTFTIDTAPGLVAVQSFIGLHNANRVVPSDEEMESEDLEARFMNGRLAMLLSSRRVVPELRSIEGLDWDVAALPTIRLPANVLHSDAFCMTSGSTRHDETWNFVEFALGTEGQRIMASTGRTVPSLREVAESPAFLDPSAAPSRSDVFLDAIPIIRALPSISTWPEIEDIADILIEEAMFEPAGGEVPELVVSLREETSDAFARADAG